MRLRGGLMIGLENFISGLKTKKSTQIYSNNSQLIFFVILISLILFLVFLINNLVLKKYYKNLRKFNDSYYFNFIVITLLKNEKGF